MEVNLRKLYPTLYSADVFVEVSDEVFEGTASKTTCFSGPRRRRRPLRQR